MRSINVQPILSKLTAVRNVDYCRRSPLFKYQPKTPDTHPNAEERVHWLINQGFFLPVAANCSAKPENLMTQISADRLAYTA